MTYLLTIIIIIEILVLHPRYWKAAKNLLHSTRNSPYVHSHFMTVTWRFPTHPLHVVAVALLNFAKKYINCYIFRTRHIVKNEDVLELQLDYRMNTRSWINQILFVLLPLSSSESAFIDIVLGYTAIHSERGRENEIYRFRSTHKKNITFSSRLSRKWINAHVVVVMRDEKRKAEWLGGRSKGFMDANWNWIKLWLLAHFSIYKFYQFSLSSCLWSHHMPVRLKDSLKQQTLQMQHAEWLGNSTSLVLVHENDIYLRQSPADEEDIRLTSTGVAGLIYNGVTDWLYQGKI